MRAAADQLVAQIVEILKTHSTHATIPAACDEIGLPGEVVEGEGCQSSKRDRIYARLAGKTHREVAAIAERVGVRYGNFELEEAGLAVLEEGTPPVTEITRRDIARCFDPPSLSGDLDIRDLLSRIWPTDQLDSSYESRHGFYFIRLSKFVHQHMILNNDMTVEHLFEALGALRCSRKRFFRLLEAVMQPVARRGPEQDQMRDRLNAVLTRDGYWLEIEKFDSGYPVYRISSIVRGVAGKPKNLIFASNGPKPQIGFRDAINNDIIILSNADSCLVYNRSLSGDGLLWSGWSTGGGSNIASSTRPRTKLGGALVNGSGSRSPRMPSVDYLTTIFVPSSRSSIKRCRR